MVNDGDIRSVKLEPNEPELFGGVGLLRLLGEGLGPDAGGPHRMPAVLLDGRDEMPDLRLDEPEPLQRVIRRGDRDEKMLVFVEYVACLLTKRKRKLSLLFEPRSGEI